MIETDKFPRSEIRICVTVLAMDGGMRIACVNATTLALAHAGVPMRELVGAGSAALVSGVLLSDPTLREDSQGAALHLASGEQSERVKKRKSCCFPFLFLTVCLLSL